MSKSVILGIFDVVVDKYADGKEKKIQLRFIDSTKFMSTSLESLMNNLCKRDCDLAYIVEYYVAHAKCRKCYAGFSKRQLNEKLIFDNFLNLRLNHTDEQFRLLLTKGIYPFEYMSS